MEVYRRSSGLVLLLGLSLLATALQGVQGEVESEGPSESECRPYIEKALKHQLGTGDPTASSEAGDSKEDIPTVEITDDSNDGEDENNEDGQQSDDIVENVSEPKIEPEVRISFFQRFARYFQRTPDKIEEAANQPESFQDKGENSSQENQPATEDEVESEQIETGQSIEQETNIEDNTETDDEHSSEEEAKESRTKRDTDDEQEKGDSDEIKETSEADPDNAQEIQEEGSIENEAELAQSSEKQTEDQTIDAQSAEEEPQSAEQEAQSTEQEAKDTEHEERSAEEEEQNVEQESVEEQVLTDEAVQNVEEARSAEEEEQNTAEETQEDVLEAESAEQVVSPDDPDKEEPIPETSQEANQESLEKEENVPEAVPVEIADDNNDSKEQDASVPNAEEIEESADSNGNENPTEVEPTEENEKSAEETTQDSTQESTGNNESEEKVAEDTRQSESNEVESVEDLAAPEDTSSAEEKEAVPVEDLSLDMEIPSEKRPRDHVEQLLKLDEGSSETEKLIKKVSESTLKELKKLYENAIKPLETLYKYRDLSNRHFGDAEIFSKPLILFMGPWSGGKSSIINYLTNNEYNETSLRTGAEPSPAYFNILMHGEEAEIIEGTELAADFTFSGLQKFGQGLEERLRGVKLPIKLLEKVNIVEIPGILEVRKQVSRVFPFNDACQWFIDRADIIFLVYDPSKLDVGPETEAILDQLKGREHQTRIVLNKADQVKPEELMRVQGALIWNISPLMSSPQPPVMYTTSLWSRPYEPWAPVRLLQSQERAFLRDLRGAIEKRIENKIASARRFAVRVRNHAKMVDCYLTTYYNHKSVFGNRKQVADEITEHPQDYHIYEGLSTLTNISRYDLPDPDVYKDFFKLNPLYEFQQLSATCTYFRGCPINRLDVAIAYDLPELVGTHKKLMEATLTSQSTGSPES